MIMTIHHQAHTRQTAVHLIIQVAVMEAVQILQAAAPVQINIIMIHTMMVMMMSIWMETMMMTDTTAMIMMAKSKEGGQSGAI